MNSILHVAHRADWLAAQRTGEYCPSSLSTEGFIHCSKPDQVVRVANFLFTGQRGLVLLVIDPAALISELKWKPPLGDSSEAFVVNELFPHVYGPLNLEAVVRVLDFESGPDGKFTLPILE